jgi:hypothetical protein
MTETPLRSSFIVNTALGDGVVRRRRDISGRAYSEREQRFHENLRRALAEGFDEVIVVGSIPPGMPEGVRGVETPPIFRSRTDALWFRELGARYSTGDLLIFSHDDHEIPEGFLQLLKEELPFDILVPKRLSLSGAELNNGQRDDYMGGHVLAMRRGVWAEVPWNVVETEWWDVTLTRLWREKGFEIRWSEGVSVTDFLE